MIRLLADNNAEGHVEILVRILLSEVWIAPTQNERQCVFWSIWCILTSFVARVGFFCRNRDATTLQCIILSWSAPLGDNASRRQSRGTFWFSSRQVEQTAGGACTPLPKAIKSVGTGGHIGNHCWECLSCGSIAAASLRLLQDSQICKHVLMGKWEVWHTTRPFVRNVLAGMVF